MKKHITGLIILLGINSVWAQDPAEQRITKYSIELRSNDNIIYHTTQTIDPKNLENSQWKQLTPKTYISNCMKTDKGVDTDTESYMDGIQGNTSMVDGEQILNFRFSKLIDKKTINLADCTIEEPVAEEANFKVNLPVIEFEETIKTHGVSYTLAIKRVAS